MRVAPASVLVHAATPRFICGTIDRIFIVRWVAEVTRPGMLEVFACMVEARRRRGVPLVAVSVVPANLDGPPHTATPTTDARFEIVDHLLEALYVVFEGDGIGRMILRGAVALRALTMRIEIAPCSTVQEAMERAARHENADPAELIEHARNAGLLL